MPEIRRVILEDNFYSKLILNFGKKIYSFLILRTKRNRISFKNVVPLKERNLEKFRMRRIYHNPIKLSTYLDRSTSLAQSVEIFLP